MELAGCVAASAHGDSRRVRRSLPALRAPLGVHVREAAAVAATTIRSRIVGVKAFAAAFAEGAMPELKYLYLDHHQIGDEGVVALAEAVGKGALPELTRLDLQANQIGDEGAVALAEAVGKGALPKLKNLDLNNNKLSRTAKDACRAVETKRTGLPLTVDCRLSQCQGNHTL